MARRFSDARNGATAVGVAVALPLILLLALGLIEFGLVIYDYQLAGRVTRRAVHEVLTNPPLANLANLSTTPVSCKSERGGVTCTGAAVLDGANTTFGDILATMQDILPGVRAENVRISYSPSGLGSAATPGIVTPIVTIDLVNLTHDFIVLSHIPALPSHFTFAPFSITTLGASATFP